MPQHLDCPGVRSDRINDEMKYVSIAQFIGSNHCHPSFNYFSAQTYYSSGPHDFDQSVADFRSRDYRDPLLLD